MRFIGLWAPVVGFMVAVILFSSPQDSVLTRTVWDKLLHAVAYAAFGLFCLRATHGGLVSLRATPTLLALLLAIGFAAVDEIHQSTVPGRHSSVGDWVADAVGVLLAAAVLHVYFRLWQANKLTGGLEGGGTTS